jgi:thioredoxin reductase (NADPH)
VSSSRSNRLKAVSQRSSQPKLLVGLGPAGRELRWLNSQRPPPAAARLSSGDKCRCRLSSNIQPPTSPVAAGHSFRAEAILQERLFANPKVEVVWDHQVDEVLGQTDPMGVTGVRLKSTKTGETRELACDGVFIAIGHAPASALFAGQLEMDASGYLKVKAGTASTAIPGVFAAGDVTDDVYRQAVTAAGMGCMAALEAVRLLAEEDHAASRAAAQ